MLILTLLLAALLQLSLADDEPLEFGNLKQLVMPAVHNRVVGGEATTVEKLGGYIVALKYQNEFICGGSLIAERIVVSAAHCFIGRPLKGLWNITGGITRIDEEGPTVGINDYITPEAFTEKGMHMDVVVLLLEKELKGENIVKIPLCHTPLKEGLKLVVSGWGLTDPEALNPHPRLRTVSVPVIKKTKCSATYKASIHISKSMFCAGILGQKDACTFDSGGPIVYESDEQRELCGIVSFGISCASPKYPGVYTDVNYIKPFIEQAMRTLLSEKEQKKAE
ncbi:seminase [Drosophila busckii]|uniref:seminase n=1 Tax=Drosophila busckii TaxID=30019 RepID=UPI00083EC31B|nr:seminase [Drosophila busckii]